MGMIEKISSFLSQSTRAELVVLAVLCLIPVFALILLIVMLSRGARERREARRMAAPPVVPTPLEPIAQTQEDEADDESEEPHAEAPIKEKVRVKLEVRKIDRIDRYTLVATGVFCAGIGFMIHQAIKGGKKDK